MLKTGQDPFLYLINSLSMHFELFCKLLEKDFFELFGFVKTLPRLRNALTPIAGVFFCRNHFSFQHSFFLTEGAGHSAACVGFGFCASGL